MSWPIVKLGELCSVVRGSSPRPKGDPRYYGGDIPRLMVSDVTRDGKYVTPRIDTLTIAGAEKSRPMKKGDFVIAVSGQPGQALILAIDACIHDGFAGLRDLDELKICKNYLFHFMNSVKVNFSAQAAGAIFKNLTTEQIRELEIPLPPLAEQKRIAAILDKADAIRRKRKQAILLADDFLRSVFIDMFGDPVTNPKGWEVKQLGNVIRLSSGNGLTAKKMDPNGVFPVYGGNGINGKHSDFMFEKPQLTIGRVGVYCGAIHITQPKSWVTDNALYVKEYLQDVNIHYLAQLLEFANLNQYAGKAAQPLVSGSRIHPLEMIFPPLSEQIKFSDIKAIFVKSFCNYCESESTINNLFNSLSQKAFAGEL
ncbi:restriction endonuclease subunit S [Shewanella inventionis]|uniref:Type I restriction modification enzyme, S subunit n=1 Tax=Shewanella inventionis TaxID=1738770 RepID=A0ABQ1JR48_9GAMM|nr:restriction endonuclease subunit S [Shewanella inventionis]MCL1159514.1 restriction endonuclease subunit S [Shewanella inventionis]GGB73496.1 type I restriction modification enzyme, S subunit [Shewanella inventionis]